MLATPKKINIPQIKSESIFIKVNSEELHLRRLYADEKGESVLMIHGSIENGKIFYSSSGKGLAPYLAQNGFDVFVADLRGRGLSKPAINRNSTHGLTEILNEDFPAMMDKIKELKGDVPQHWVAHSWGGVMMLAWLAQNFNRVKVSSMVFFATKRRITAFNTKKIWMINIMWNFAAKIFILFKGYLPAREMKIGSDNESRKSHRETTTWVNSKKWLGWNNRFDYAAGLKKLSLPPILYLAGASDKVLGHPKDVKLLIKETGSQNYEFKILGKSNGNLHDYGHIDILTHSDAEKDVYPVALSWMICHK